MFNLVKRMLSRGRRDARSVEDLRMTFKERHSEFKLLLNANNRALDVMAEIEEALKGNQPFGMALVRERCIRASTCVYMIIKHLNNLAPGKYKTLHEKYREIWEQIIPFLNSPATQKEGPLVLSLDQIDKDLADQVGGKMANLGEIRNKVGLQVPNGFVITTAAFQLFMDHNNLPKEIERRIHSVQTGQLDELFELSSALQKLIMDASIPGELQEAIRKHYASLKKTEGEGLAVAVRSSALGEDILRSIFAGMYRSVLNVRDESILHTYKEVVASKYNLHAITYRLARGISDEDVAMSVGCVAMVDAVAGGVLYSRNPLNMSDDSIVIDSSWGLPKLVVDGSAESDHFVVSRDEPLQIIKKKIPVKRRKYVCSQDEGVHLVEIGYEHAAEASITDEQAEELARLAVRLEDHYQSPRDVEWCLDKNGSLIILQCRPLKQTDVSGQQIAPGGPELEREQVILQGGITAAPGAAAGPVFFVQQDMDVLKFPEGAVMVADQALPRWATLLNRAVAVITEQGGVAGHLANVAREFGVPALFSVKGAIDILGPGQIVTVDADGLKVYDGRIPELLRKEVRTSNLMEGSPAFEALKNASEHIVHLNLLDPDALSFKAENCRTFHDITRFCHEKSVSEMFNFGKDHHFPERSSKQLLVDAPMKWWVLNLDDGYKKEVEGKYVELDNITSTPMLALWEGITAVPWAGPPPVDGKGLMSVMFQATQNTSLVTGVPSKYAERNYFMVSKDYCCLSSRLGFHFATVESLITESAAENYISFQFKGGAADYERRRRRIFFVKEILEGYHFKVDIKEDNLIARLEDYDRDFMTRSLKIVGYLAIHTRQLDMIMSNSALVKQYRNKICRDIQKLFVREKILYLYVGDKEESSANEQ